MMKRFLKEIFKCRHKNALLDSNEGFCPDCGKYLKKSYFVVRCKHCGIKRLAKKHFEEVFPAQKFCKNCGGEEFIVEKYEKLNLVDINYAIEVKKEVENKIVNELEIWVESPNPGKENGKKSQTPKQIPQQVPLLQKLKYA